MDESDRKRSYHSPRRQEQAHGTRQKILAAAERLFVSDGYAATTLPSVAREAGVSPATITVVFGTKSALLDALIKSTVRGDEAPAPLGQRSWWQEMLHELDPGRQLRLFAAISRRIHQRTTDIAEIVRGAATADPEIALLRQRLGESRLQDNREVAESLARKGALASGITVEQVTDLIWTLASADVYRMLVVNRGWSAERYEEWLATTLAQSILTPLLPTY